MKNRNIFFAVVTLLTALLWSFGVENGYALKTFSIKAAAGTTLSTHGTLTVSQVGGGTNLTSPLATAITSGGHVRFTAAPAAGRRCVWYINGIKLQGQLLNLSAILGIPATTAEANYTTAGNFDWYRNTDVGTKGDAGAISYVYDGGAGAGNRTEILTVQTAQLSAVVDVQVEFIKDISYLATITVSSEDATSAANGFRGAAIIDRAVWMTSNTAAPTGGLPVADPFNAQRFIQFDLKSAKYIERIECRRRPNNSDKVTKYNVILYDASWNVLFNKIETLDARTEDGNTLIPTFGGTAIPNGVGGRDKVTFVEGGPKAARYVRINILDYRNGDGTEGGSNPGTHKPGFDRVKIIEAEASTPCDVFFQEINPDGGKIEAFSGGYIEGAGKGTDNLFITSNTGRLVDAAPLTAGYSVPVNKVVYFKATPKPGWRVKWFIINGEPCAMRVGNNYKSIDMWSGAIGSEVIGVNYCLGSVGQQGNLLHLIANNQAFPVTHSASSTEAGRSLYVDEIIGMPVTAGEMYDVQVEFEKDLAIYSTITANAEGHQDYGQQACKYGVTVGPSNWFQSTTATGGVLNGWLKFDFNGGTKQIGEIRIYTRGGDRPTKVRLEFFVGGSVDASQTEEVNLDAAGGQVNSIYFYTPKVAQGVRITTLAINNAANTGAAGYQRIQILEPVVPEHIYVWPVEGDDIFEITENKGQLQFVSQVYPYDAPQEVIWTVSDENIATIDQYGLLTARGNGEVTVYATSVDYPGVRGGWTLNISGQIEIPEIRVWGAGNVKVIPAIGGILQMNAQVYPAGAYSNSFTWSVDDENLAEISSSGVLKSKAAEGVVLVTACSTENTELCGSILIFLGYELEFRIFSSDREPGPEGLYEITEPYGQMQLFVETHPNTYNVTSIDWSVSDESIATIDQDGVLTAISDGEVVVTAVINGNGWLTAVTTVLISGQVIMPQVYVWGEDYKWNIPTVGGTLQLYAEVYPEDETVTSFTWSVDDENFATITQSGLLTSKKEGEYVSVEVCAKDRPDIICGYMSVYLGVLLETVVYSDDAETDEWGNYFITENGGELQMKVKVEPEGNITIQKVTWWVTDDDLNPTNLATISSTGLLKAKADGSVIVFVKVNDDENLVAGRMVYISGQEITPGLVQAIDVYGAGFVYNIPAVGGKLQMIADVFPDDAIDKSVTWSVDNTSIATISSTGLLTAQSEGDVVVYAHANDASGVYGSVTICIGECLGTTIEIYSDDSVTDEWGNLLITEDRGQLQLKVRVIPPGAVSIAKVTWSVVDLGDYEEAGSATIDEYGLLTAEANGEVLVNVEINDDPELSAGIYVLISGQGGTKIKDSFVSDLNVYPIPFVDVLHINGAENSNLRITNALGVTKLVQKINSAKESLNFSQLAAGVYFFNFEKDGLTKTVKVVKK